MAVDAPEAGQDFGDVARKHLSDLVYDKSVLVEYWGIAADGSLVGRVMLNNTDIGAQMIRDGAAWFDASNQGRLAPTDREIYQQSEQAARSERRGLWQADAPVAPWEFARATELRREPVASLNSVLPAAKSRPNRPTPELTSLTLMASRLASPPASSPAAPSREAADTETEEMLWASAEDSGPKNWKPFRPEGENFSVVVPDDGLRKQKKIPVGEQLAEVNVYAARDGHAVYALMWVTGPSFGEEDKPTISDSVRGFLYGFAEGYKRRNNEDFSCEPQDERHLYVNGFSGSDYDLPSCTVPAKVRAYSRVVGGQRQMYIAAVFYVEDELKASRFIKSFTVTTTPRKSTAQKH
ncbi:MAG TPA: thermonuclease family protein [Candidatus Limnocylindria bacterium]|nr:thermonuclease family protein [Candidatus Limnocylindria bacterium]